MREKSSHHKTILFTIDDYVVSGVTTFVRQYTEVATKLGYETIILGFVGDIQNPQSYFPNSATITIPHSMQYGLFGRLISFIRYRQALVSVYKTTNIHCVHLSTTWSTLTTFTLRQSWKISRVITFYGLYDKEISFKALRMNNFFFKSKNWIRKQLQFMSLYFADTIITFSLYAKTLLYDSFGEIISKKTLIIPGFVQSVSPSYKKSKTSSLLRIVNFGRAETRKGIDNLLMAISIANKKHQRFSAVIASPIWYYTMYSTLHVYEKLGLFDSVTLTHAASDANKANLLAKADVFVFPSEDLETFGMTMLESLAHGIPVIGTPVGAIPEVLSRIDHRLLTTDTSPESIANRLIWFSRLTYKQRRKLSQKSLMVVSKFYTQDLFLETFNTVYKSL